MPVEIRSHRSDLERRTKLLTSLSVAVGVPGSTAPREPDPATGETPGINNAALLYIHENGAPEAGIPARPTVGPAIREDKAEIAIFMKKVGEDTLSGDLGEEGIMRRLDILGLKVSADIKRRFGGPDLQALAEATIKNRLRKGRTGDLPLLDEGQLRNAITYVVTKEKG